VLAPRRPDHSIIQPLSQRFRRDWSLQDVPRSPSPRTTAPPITTIPQAPPPPPSGDASRHGSSELGLNQSPRQCLHALLAYFDFEGQGQEGTGVHAEAEPFKLNYQDNAPCQFNCRAVAEPAASIMSYLIGSGQFNIAPLWLFQASAGRSQSNAAPSGGVCLAGLGFFYDHSLQPALPAWLRYVLSRATANQDQLERHSRS